MDKGAHERPFVVLSALWKQLFNFLTVLLQEPAVATAS